MSDIFISYSKSDRAKVQVLAKALEGEGWSVWWDPKIRPGQSFDKVIERALEAARCVIVLWSKKSAQSDYVNSEAWEAKQRGILIPVLIEDDVKIPLDFRRLHASRLADWNGEESGHLEFDELKNAIGELLGRPAGPPGATTDIEATNIRTIVEPAKPDQQREIPEGIYLDAETKLMWTKEDNGQNINWHAANEYAKQLRLGGHSDWRLPTTDQLKKLFDPKVNGEFKIRKPFKLSGGWVWSSTKALVWAWFFEFDSGEHHFDNISSSDFRRALCVRHSGE